LSYNKAISQIGTNVVFNAGLLARSQFAAGRPSRSRFSVVFLGPRANAELIPSLSVSVGLVLGRTEVQLLGAVAVDEAAGSSGIQGERNVRRSTTRD
jgi:hypothetical protein